MDARPKDIPWAGRFRGHEGAIKYFALIEAEAEIDVFELHTFLAQGDKVVLGYENR